MTLNHVRPWRNIHRRKSRQIMVGDVPVGGDAPIAVQTMTNTLTTDVAATVVQVQAAAEAGATAVIQPGGSMRDADVIAAADEAGLAMVFTGMRHFRH